MYGYIYVIENDINDKKYIGKTTLTIEERFKEHLLDSSRRKKEHRPLYSAMNKYGIEHFSIRQIEKVDVKQLDKREQYWINFYDCYKNGYNATLGGEGTIKYDYDKIISLYNQGFSQKEIAKQVGCCVDIVSKVLKMSHIDTKQNGYNFLGNKLALYSDNIYKEFNTQGQAAKWLIENGYAKGNLENVRGNIGRALKGIYKTSYGFKFKYI